MWRNRRHSRLVVECEQYAAKIWSYFQQLLIKAQRQLTYTLEKMQRETINNFNHSESGINYNNSHKNTSLKQIKRIEAAI